MEIDTTQIKALAVGAGRRAAALLLAMFMLLTGVFAFGGEASALEDPVVEEASPQKNPTTPRITHGSVTPSANDYSKKTVRFSWTRSSHSDGIHGYSIYLDGEYRGWSPTTSMTYPFHLKAGTRISIVAVASDRSSMSAKSEEWIVGANLLAPSSAVGKEPQAGTPAFNTFVFSQTNGVVNVRTSAPDNSNRIAGYNLYVDGNYEKTIWIRDSRTCTELESPNLSVAFFTEGSNPSYSPRSRESAIAYYVWPGPGSKVCFTYAS